MNIVVVGGGTRGKFGNDFVVRARNEGHNVVIISHKSNDTNDQFQFITDYSSVEAVVEIFTEATKNFDKIDIMVYNVNAGTYPSFGNNKFIRNGRPLTYNWVEQSYYKSLRLHVIYPHVLISECYKKMSEGCKIIFLTTYLALDFKRIAYTNHAGYAGAKSFQTHLMLGLAHNENDKKIIFSSMTPHFDYNNLDKYKAVFDTLYEYVINHGSDMNGKIVACWDNDGLKIIN